MAVFSLRPFFVMQAMMTPQAINPKPTRMHIVTIMSAPLYLRYAGIVADCQDITRLKAKAFNGFTGVTGGCSGTFVLEENFTVIGIHTNVNSILLENLSESIRAVHSGLRISRAGYLVEEINLKGLLIGSHACVVADCQDIAFLKAKPLNGFIGVAGRYPGALVLEENFAVIGIHANVNRILLKNLPESVRGRTRQPEGM